MKSRLPKFRATTPAQLLDWGYKIVDNLGLHKNLQGDDVSKLVDTKIEFSNPSENDGAFGADV